jgi:hypothetical protein
MDSRDAAWFLALKHKHPEFEELCLKLVHYARLHNIPTDLVWAGVAWNSREFLQSKIMGSLGYK